MSLFGFEAEPNTALVSPITASFFSGANLVGEFSIDVNGSAGARLFAASSTVAFDRIEIKSSDDFAIAQLRVVAIPEPMVTVLTLQGLGLIWFNGCMHRTRKNHAQG